jgi:hypothetical protein
VIGGRKKNNNGNSDRRTSTDSTASGVANGTAAAGQLQQASTTSTASSSKKRKSASQPRKRKSSVIKEADVTAIADIVVKDEPVAGPMHASSTIDEVIESVIRMDAEDEKDDLQSRLKSDTDLTAGASTSSGVDVIADQFDPAAAAKCLLLQPKTEKMDNTSTGPNHQLLQDLKNSTSTINHSPRKRILHRMIQQEGSSAPPPAS